MFESFVCKDYISLPHQFCILKVTLKQCNINFGQPKELEIFFWNWKERKKPNLKSILLLWSEVWISDQTETRRWFLVSLFIVRITKIQSRRTVPLTETELLGVCSDTTVSPSFWHFLDFCNRRGHILQLRLIDFCGYIRIGINSRWQNSANYFRKKPDLVIGICFTRESPFFVRKDFNEWGKRKKFLSK